MNSTLAQELNHQAVGFSSVLDELAPVVEALFIKAEDLFSWWSAKHDAVFTR
jgi:hypothetical protein